MPFKSEKQRRYMWMAHPDIAEKWAHGQHSTSGGSNASGTRKTTKRKGRRGGRS